MQNTTKSKSSGSRRVIARNKRAEFDYYLFDKFLAGMQLVGSEVKSIRLGHISLDSSFVIVENGEVYLRNAKIETYRDATQFTVAETRDRKLLLNRKEIQKIANKVKTKGYTVVATQVCEVNGYFKVEIALAKGKKIYDKKECKKQKDVNRDAMREIRAKFG